MNSVKFILEMLILTYGMRRVYLWANAHDYRTRRNNLIWDLKQHGVWENLTDEQRKILQSDNKALWDQIKEHLATVKNTTGDVTGFVTEVLAMANQYSKDKFGLGITRSEDKKDDPKVETA